MKLMRCLKEVAPRTLCRSGMFLRMMPPPGCMVAALALLVAAQSSAWAQSLVSEITVTPTNPTMMVGQTLRFTAQGFDTNGAPVDIIDPHWECEGGTFAPVTNGNDTVAPQCDFTAATPGPGYILCYEGPPSSGGPNGSADITIQGGGAYLARIDVTPSSVDMTVGHQMLFTATGYDQNGNIYNFDPQWSATGGTINSNGAYTATVPGSFTVTCTAKGFTISGSGSIMVNDTYLARIDVTPVNTTLRVGDTTVFTATGYGAAGQRFYFYEEWSATGGTINSNGAYTATVPGDFTVICTDINTPGVEGRARARVHTKHGDFDGDGKADPGGFQPNPGAGLWQVLLSGSGYYGASGAVGASGYVPIIGDFDGDGKFDPAVYREADGHWIILYSGSGYTPLTLQLGGAGWTPAAGDYDGDGKTDPGVFSSAAGRWQVKLSSSDAIVPVDFGAAGALAAPGDYDGDGMADPAYYLPASGAWWFKTSAAGWNTVGPLASLPGGLPVAADYDGDRKDDPAVFLSATGEWNVLCSGGGYASVTAALGGIGAQPAPMDYDGDGKADPTAYWSAAGAWTFRLSGNAYAPMQANFMPGIMPAW